MRIVQDAVADRVGERRVGEVVVPLRRRQLTRDSVESPVKLLVGDEAA
jgi:hypothetical protein